jgi:hypothetical protein
MDSKELDDLWKAVNALRGEVSGLSSKIEAVLTLLGERCEARVKVIDDHEQRIRAVEKKIWWIPGGTAVVALAIYVFGLLRGH